MAVKILDNCCSPFYLDMIKHIASNDDNWNLKYPMGKPLDEKHLKLDVIDNDDTKHPLLAGIAMGLLIQIYEAGGKDFFLPEIYFCGLSIKDKNRKDNIHTDHNKKDNVIKILGVVNSDWQESWGGGFTHDGVSNYIKPTSFALFDSTIPHAASDILTDNKRMAIDFTVRKK
tara:strand:+ start:78 stop:593 length:516 start_codon:yes stop_codon:yes gene_type:complete